MKIALSEIVIRERVRKDLGDLSPLMASMQKHGQLNPITISRDNELIAGHRRLLSARELGWSYIDALIVDRDSEVEKLQLELEENVHRKDFCPEELLAGYRRLEKLLRPRLTTRIARFFGNLFAKLFSRRNRNKDLSQPMLGTTADITPDAGTGDTQQFSATDPQDRCADVGQYGV
jgi:ParB family chromosome partitioning protein